MIPALPPWGGEQNARRANDDPNDPNGGSAELRPRFEDVTQDGRMVLTGLMPGLDEAVWGNLLGSLPAIDTFRAEGILPIRRRVVIVGEPTSISVHSPVRYDGTWRFAREKGGDRLFLNMWLEARAPVGSTFGPPPTKDAEHVVIGRVFAEHVITRPFAPPAERKVTKLEGPGLPAVESLDEYVFESAESLLERDVTTDAEGATQRDFAGDFAFGTMHTDSNQHVNSLVYPRVFEEFVVRRLASASARDAALVASVNPTSLLARAVEMRWRKPFFAGERADVTMRLVAPLEGSAWKLGAVGTFEPGGSGSTAAATSTPSTAKPNCTIKVWMA